MALVGRKDGERLVAFNEDVDLRSLICRGSEELRSPYGRLRDQIEGKGLAGALRGRRAHISYAQVFWWTETGGEDAGAVYTCVRTVPLGVPLGVPTDL